MATFNYMSWNIEIYGKAKWNKNRNERIEVVARTINFESADLVTIMELISSFANPILVAICNSLNQIRGAAALPQDWAYTSVTGNDLGKTGSSETYGFLYRTSVMTPELTPNGTIVKGRSTTDRAGNALKFPTRNNKTGNGRKPAYCAFRETTNNNLFSVVTYHAPFSGVTFLGVKSMGFVREAYEVNTADPGGAENWVPVHASLISGDFNINYPDAITNAYDPLEDRPPNGPGGVATIYAKSTLRAWDKNPPFPPASAPSVWWRVSAYDNIFCTQNATAAGPGIVVDMISELGRWNAGSDQNFPPPGWAASRGGLYTFNLPQAFNMARERDGAQFIVLPIATSNDSWAFYRLCISDHLPVRVSVTI